jgi:soluble cytochrome b562
MELVQIKKTNDTKYTLDDAMNILLSKLDDAIDDIEQGRVQSIDEAWKEIDSI